MATTNAFDSTKPFNSKAVSYKYMSFTYHAKKKNRLMIQQNFDIEEECPICLESMINKPVMYTPCKHRFHTKCMFTMMGGLQVSNHSCPLCRHDLLTAIMKLNSSNLYYYIVIDVPANIVAPANAVAPANIVAPANAVAPANIVAPAPDEIISLFDSISEGEYDDDDDESDESDESDEVDESDEAELGDTGGLF